MPHVIEKPEVYHWSVSWLCIVNKVTHLKIHECAFFRSFAALNYPPSAAVKIIISWHNSRWRLLTNAFSPTSFRAIKVF